MKVCLKKRRLSLNVESASDKKSIIIQRKSLENTSFKKMISKRSNMEEALKEMSRKYSQNRDIYIDEESIFNEKIKQFYDTNNII